MKASKLLIISVALFIMAFYIFGIYCIGQSDAIQTVENTLSIETNSDENTDLSTIQISIEDTEADSDNDGMQIITVFLPPDLSDNRGGVDLGENVVVPPYSATSTKSGTTKVADTTTTTPHTTATTKVPTVTKTEVTPITTSVPAVTSSATKTPSKTTTTTKTTTTKTTTKTTAKTTTKTTAKKTTTTTTAAKTTTSATAKSGWQGTLTVKNNLSSSASYGQVVTDDAFTIVCRNVEAEMGSSYHPEALKAQAVAAYSFIKTQRNVPSLPLADKVSDAVKNACASVNGLAAFYNGSYAQTVYHASSGGYTANANEVWGSHIPYLVSVSCPVDAQYDRNYGISSVFSSDDIANRVKTATGITLTGDPSKWFKLTRSSSGYVTYVDIAGQGRITGQQFRANVMSYKIKSHNMSLKYDSATDSFTITTYGYGHGVGMSQTGAHYYAKYSGWNYQKILYHFYTGITIKKVG